MVVGPVLAHEGVTSPLQMPGGQVSGSQNLSEMFLQLLLKELSNQDPLNPMNGADFITQLAQLSALEQMASMNTALEAIRDMQQMAQASALVGRHVRATQPDGSVIEGRVMAVDLRDSEIMLDVDGVYTIPMSAVSEISGTPAADALGEQLVSLLSGAAAAPADSLAWFNPYQTEV